MRISLSTTEKAAFRRGVSVHGVTPDAVLSWRPYRDSPRLLAVVLAMEGTPMGPPSVLFVAGQGGRDVDDG